MPFCTNCGASINNETKFCPSCGTKIGMLPKDIIESSKRKMEKGVVKSLQKETSSYVKPKIKEIVSPKTQKDNLFTNEEANIKDDKPIVKSRKSSHKLILFYILLNILLFILGDNSDEISGLKFFSVVILVIYFIRHKNEKPINWLLKIILALQLILLFSIFMVKAEYLFANFFSFLETLTLSGLFVMILLLLIKGNKTQ